MKYVLLIKLNCLILTPSDIFTNKSAITTIRLNNNLTYLHTSNAKTNSQIIIEIVLGPELFYFDSEARKFIKVLITFESVFIIL